MRRLLSLGYAPAETRRFLRDRFARFLPSRTGSFVRSPRPVTLPDEVMLALLDAVDIEFASDLEKAHAIYEAAIPDNSAEPNFESLIEAGWFRPVWGHVASSSELFRAAHSPPANAMTALVTLMERRHDQTYSFSDAVRARPDLAETVSALERGDYALDAVGCPTPEWVAARLWQTLLAKLSHPGTTLRAWVDRWAVLGYPNFIPQRAWDTAALAAFCEAALYVLDSDHGLPRWDEARDLFAKRIALANNQPLTNINRLLPPIPSTLIGRALWLDGHHIDTELMHETGASEELRDLNHLLLADIGATEQSSAPHPLAVDLFKRGIERPELLFGTLLSIDAYPALLADLALHPPTSPLACLLVAKWPVGRAGWDRELSSRDDHATKAIAFADAVSVLGQLLEKGSVPPEEIAPLLVWAHDSARSEGETRDGGQLLSALRTELIGHTLETLRRIVLALMTSSTKAGLGSPSYAAALDVIELGNLTADIDPQILIEPYVTAVALGDYSLSARGITVSAAASLFEMAKRASDDLHRKFLRPIDVKARLVASKAAGENPFTVLDILSRSLRAHIRVLSRAAGGSANGVDDNLVDALSDAVRAGALQHEEKGHVPAFSPSHETNLHAIRDRPIAADLGAALHALRDQHREKLLAAILQTDEPMVLAQLLSYAPEITKARIRNRIIEITPEDAGRTLSLPEVQARIDMLLSAGLLDAAESFMGVEQKLQTMGRVAGRELARLRWQLRLLLGREDWTGIASVTPPASMPNFEQSEAIQIIEFYKALAALRRPDGDLKVAEEIFDHLQRQRPDIVSYAVNFYATRISRLLGGNVFGQLQGSDLITGRRMLRDGEEMLSRARGVTSSDNEIYGCNKAMLLLALGEPEQANSLLASIRSTELRDNVVAFTAVARARMGNANEAAAILDEVKQRVGETDLIRAARANIDAGLSYIAPPTVSTDDDSKQRIKAALTDLRHLSARQQAAVMHPQTETLLAYVTKIVRSSAGRLTGLVPMFKGAVPNLHEDDFTAFLRELLGSQVGFLDWTFPDQTKGGYSAKGNPGERDLVLIKDGDVLAVIEAVIYESGSSRQNLTSHFQKLFGYATCSLFFHLTYSFAQDPAPVLGYLKQTAQNDPPVGFSYRNHEEVPTEGSQPTGFIAHYDGPSASKISVVFLLLEMGQHAQRGAAKTAGGTRVSGNSLN